MKINIVSRNTVKPVPIIKNLPNGTFFRFSDEGADVVNIRMARGIVELPSGDHFSLDLFENDEIVVIEDVTITGREVR